MTERDWLFHCKQPLSMLDRVVRGTSTRKLQLISSAACGLLNDLRTRPDLWHAVEVLARYADGSASEHEFVEARANVTKLELSDTGDATWEAVDASLYSVPQVGTRYVLGRVVSRLTDAAVDGQHRVASDRAKVRVCDILREVIGNPFRDYLAVPSWQGGGVIQPDGRTVLFTDAVKGLADAVHVTGDFGRLPILADALEEAGVTDEALLAHCRDGGPHLRGCWALDVVRGRA